jgi:DNA-binding GntR family transcriptional regulator
VIVQLSNRRSADSSIDQPEVKRGTPLYEQIYDALWKLIFSGEIAPGQRLSDRDWALRLNTSRTPVREAMRQMARDGVLVSLENGGYGVQSVDPEGLANLYKCRAPLAALAVHDTTLAGNKRLFTDIADVIRNISNAIVKRDADKALKLNSRFHDLIVEGCQNPHLINIMRNLEKLILFYRIALVKKSAKDNRADYFDHLGRAAERQMEIAVTMERGDAAAAARLMEQHLLLSAEDMARLLPVE